MIVNIKGINLEASFSVETFVDIVEYKKRYEPHDKVSLTQYLQSVTDDSRYIDTVIDILYYPHAIKMRKLGLLPQLEWKDIAVHIATNEALAVDIINDLVSTLPEAENSKKKTSKTTKVGS
jgi:hypothetical protein